MPKQISRSRFLRGQFSRYQRPFRPPWARPEHEFVEYCQRCDDCGRACPAGIVERGPAGFPMLNFSRGGCQLCGACVRACPVPAFREPGGVPWRLRAAIGGRCLAMRGIECRSCADQCEGGVIRFRLQVGGAALPTLDDRACNGCGACVSVCPEAAIDMVASDEPGG